MSRGFSLVELMIVVVILGVLSALALPAYMRQRYRGQAVEASEVLSRVVAAQEAYRAEFTTYSDASNDLTLTGVGAHTSGALGTWHPATGSGLRNFYTNLPTSWNQLGVRPRELVRYSYATCAGNPGVIPSLGPAGDLGYAALPLAQQGVWFFAAATGDLDANGVFSRYEVSSLQRGITVRGYDLD
jgi:prepilin-type N-terminal cleavage/methylation domain-containing protein